MISILQNFSQQTELTQMSEILVIVIIITGLLKWLKQPLVIGYLIAGIIVGPAVLDLAHAHDESFIELFSHLGIALLLFMVGLGLNPGVIKEHGKVSLGVGAIQIVVTFVLGFIISSIFGFDWITSAYVAAGLTFSSTIVIVKILSDKRETEHIFGKISLGVLIIQDIVVMLLLMLVSIIGESSVSGDVSNMLISGIILFVGIFVVVKYVIPRVLRAFASSQEFLLLVGIARCLMLATLFRYVGFSFEIGSLIAGMSFAMSPYRRELATTMRSLRDFFLVIFFISVGMQLEFDAIGRYLGISLVLALFVLLIKPASVRLAVRWHGYTNNTALKAGLSLAQVSEFSFILMGIGISLGHVKEPGLLSVMMFVGLITICLSTYMTIYNNQIYSRWKRVIKEKDLEIIGKQDGQQEIDILLFGYGRMGSFFAEVFEKNEMSYLVVDHDPAVTQKLQKKGVPYVFGDASNDEIYQDVLEAGVDVVISTIKQLDDDRLIIKYAKQFNPDISVIVVSNNSDDIIKLYEHGADYVIMPDYISAHHAGEILEEIGFDIKKLIHHKNNHLEVIRNKSQNGLIELFKKLL